MGNSITDAWINISPGFFKTNPSYIDRGISGQTTPQMLIRFRQDVIELHPKVVLILAGINDIAGNTGPSTLDMIENNLASMAQLAKVNGIKVILCSVLPAYDFPWRAGIDPVQKIIDLNKWIKEFSIKNNFIYLDYYSAMVDERKGLPAKYSKDGVHPNAAGYKVMEPMAAKAISRALKEK
jgi:lysophospholipase L1-like esterase